jgi:hypothetical protein
MEVMKSMEGRQNAEEGGEGRSVSFPMPEFLISRLNPRSSASPRLCVSIFEVGRL